MKNIIFILFAFIIISSCKKKSEECPPFFGQALPTTLYFVIKTNNTRLPDSILNSTKLYYLSSNSKNYISDFGRAGSNGYNLGAMITREIGFKSGDDKIKDFYLEFPSGDIDTLYVDYGKLTGCEAAVSSCGCLYPRNIVKYNGLSTNYDPTITEQQVYLFNKF
jgi:hypothetical protein